MLSTNELKEKAGVISQQMNGLPVSDALRILNAAMAQVLNESIAPNDQSMTKPFISSLANFLPRHRGRPRGIESDAEVQRYIHTIHERRTFQQISEMCLVKFGKKRAPSKSAIQRYIQDLTEKFKQEASHNE